ncbi:DNA binding helix-turn helix protein [Dunaliella salina]|uniref:DNA binding helix-turn helix protein n=1 Tax=Dunaliella salina TaxID=3046 RepID=A0ABQ7GH34_DUNSA|nr:DNA binding helix-turn helix protein [Dunaliella salina]|eukprot:KAF5833921.1 DNA binding helix-turn helix protein [Dunaliella salina]
MMQGQDFQEVVIRKKAPKQSDLKDAAAVNAARRAGHQIETAQKFGAGSNKHAPTTAAGKSAAKLEQETEDFHRECRLDVSINEKPQVIQEYESGKAIPNPQVLSKLSRILGVQLKK